LSYTYDQLNYYFADHLGTSRVVTSATGTTFDTQQMKIHVSAER